MTETVNYYLDKITPWHAGRPRFRATVGAFVTPLVQLQEMIAHLPLDFDVDYSIGAQEDVDGEWIGRSRHILVPDPNLYFTLDDPLRGLDVGIWKGPYDTSFGTFNLDDDTYRQLLYAKIAANNWDGTVPGMQAVLDLFFSNPDTLLFVQDNSDMSMVVGVSGKVPPPLYLAILSRGYLPLKPAGVKLYYEVTSVDQVPLFGLDMSSDYVDGLDRGAWGVSPDVIINSPPGGPGDSTDYTDPDNARVVPGLSG